MHIQLTTLTCYLFTQKHSLLDTPGNVLYHHSKHLMGYFEFLNGSKIIYLPLNILKIALTTCL